MLRTTRKAVYAMVYRGALPGVVRLSRRILVDSHELQAWLERQVGKPPAPLPNRPKPPPPPPTPPVPRRGGRGRDEDGE